MSIIGDFPLSVKPKSNSSWISCALQYVFIWVNNTVELVCNVTKGTEYFVSLYTDVAITEEYIFMVNFEELFGTTKYLTL
jgi:hypothetical protein